LRKAEDLWTLVNVKEQVSRTVTGHNFQWASSSGWCAGQAIQSGPAILRSKSEENMNQTVIFGPFFATMLLTLIVWIYMYVRRINFITSSKISSQDLAVPGALARVSPPAVSNPSDNLKNLFEIPVLFYALTLYLFATKQVDALYVDAAWVFVAFRALHSAVHCTFNLVMLRFYLYLFSTLAVWFITIRAALNYFGA